MPSRPCQAVCCKATVQPGRFLCSPHWHALPKPLRDQVNATWRARQRASAGGVRAGAQYVVAHVEACDEARRFTAEREGVLEQYRPDADRIKRIYARAAEALADG